MLSTQALLNTIEFLKDKVPYESVPTGSKVIELIDMGHGGFINDVYVTAPRKMYDHDEFQFYEGLWNRVIGWMYASELYQSDLGYYIVTPGNKDYTLTERYLRANHFHAKMQKMAINTYYHSIHGNAFGVESVKGIEVYTSPGQTLSDPIATVAFNKLEELLGWRMRPGLGDGDPDKEAKFTVLVKTHMPAILSESGFYTNFAECTKMLTFANMVRIVRAFKETHEIVIHKNLLKKQ